MPQNRHEKNKALIPLVERNETVRKYITALLEENTLTAKDISQPIRITEKEVCDHLEHIRKTLNKNNRRLETIPAECAKCGFTFRKRDRLSKPGKCPLCHSNLIRPPGFHIVKTK